MNYIIINENRYNLTDDGIGVDENNLMLTILSASHNFEEIKKAFESIGDAITIYGTVDGGADFESSVFNGYTQLKAVNYDVVNELYTVHLIVPDDLIERMDELENAVNFLIMGGE